MASAVGPTVCRQRDVTERPYQSAQRLGRTATRQDGLARTILGDICLATVIADRLDFPTSCRADQQGYSPLTAGLTVIRSGCETAYLIV